ncbi:hypothetical protein [Caulobacter sp. 17J65-9]|uniref:hypothetical protein n=1 Tax=Caulobacter sp. 17J65-9 TaxID=2709382 RepID=UPI0013CA5D81|nr:hypothetical protein [Caulobacter sp. 17J65-9]NEX92296.1 hypothetical protein [Caulobacter sp. 17J65-9]
MPHRPTARGAPFIGVVWLVAAGLLVLSLGQDLLLLEAPDAAVRRVWLIDVGREDSLLDWLHGGVLAAIAVLLFKVGRAERAAGDEFAAHWHLLAVAFGAVAVGELTHLHEPVLRATAPALHPTWPPSPALGLAIAAFALLGAAYARFVAAMPVEIRTLAILVAVLFAVDAAAFDPLVDAARRAQGPDGLGFRLTVTLEEALELSAAALTLYAVSLCRRLQQADGRA